MMIDKTRLVFRDTPTAADIGAVRRIIEGTNFFRPDEVAVAVELVEERLAKGVDSGYFFWFIDIQGEPAGYVCYGPTPCTIGSYDLYWIAVAVEWQGRGLGLELTRKTEESIAAQGGRRIYIETSGKDLYRPTRRFYEQAGYFEAVILPDFYDINDHKIIYQKNL